MARVFYRSQIVDLQSLIAGLQSISKQPGPIDPAALWQGVAISVTGRDVPQPKMSSLPLHPACGGVPYRYAPGWPYACSECGALPHNPHRSRRCGEMYSIGVGAVEVGCAGAIRPIDKAASMADRFFGVPGSAR